MREADIDIRLMDYYLSELLNYNKSGDVSDTPETLSKAPDLSEEKLADDSTDAH